MNAKCKASALNGKTRKRKHAKAVPFEYIYGRHTLDFLKELVFFQIYIYSSYSIGSTRHGIVVCYTGEIESAKSDTLKFVELKFVELNFI